MFHYSLKVILFKVIIKFISRSLLYFFLILSTRSCNNYFRRGNDKCSFGSRCPIKHFLYHSLKGIYNCSFCYIFSSSLDLISLQILCIIYRNRNSSIVRFDIVYCCLKKNISNNKLSIIGDIFESNRYYIWFSICTGRKISHTTL